MKFWQVRLWRDVARAHAALHGLPMPERSMMVPDGIVGGGVQSEAEWYRTSPLWNFPDEHKAERYRYVGAISIEPIVRLND